MFILSYKLGNVQSTDVTVAVPAPVDCRIESAHIICSVAVASGADPKVSCEVYADDDATKLFIADSAASGFAQNVPVPMVLQDGVSKRFEAGQAIQLKLDFLNSLASVTDIAFYLKCVPARDI
jgi:hypothetical protein